MNLVVNFRSFENVFNVSFFLFLVVFARSGYCYNFTQASDLVRCVCKAIIGSMVEYSGVRVLQLFNVRLVKFSPYLSGNSSFKYLVDPSYQFAQSVSQRALRAPLVIKITDLHAEYYMLDIMMGFDCTTYRSSEERQDVVRGTYFPMGKIPNLRTEAMRLKKRKYRDNKAAAKVAPIIPEKKRAPARKDLNIVKDYIEDYYSDISTGDDLEDPGEGTSAMARVSEVRYVPDVSSVPVNVEKVLIHSVPDDGVSMDIDAPSSLVNIEDNSSINVSDTVASVDVLGNSTMQNIKFSDFDVGEYINFDEMASEIGPINLEDFDQFLQ